jgi:hypothetical protein
MIDSSDSVAHSRAGPGHRYRRGRRLFLLVAGAAVLLTGIPAAISIRQSILETETRRYASNLDDMTARRKLDEAQVLWRWLEQNNPQALRHPLLRDSRRKLDLATTQLAQDRQQFRIHLDAAKTAGAVKPDWDAIKLAWAHAVTAEDQIEIQRWENQVRQQAAQRQGRTDADFLEQASKLQKLFDLRRTEVVGLLSTDPAAAESVVREMQTRAEGLVRRPDVSTEALAGVLRLQTELDSWKNELAVNAFHADADHAGRCLATSREYLDSPSRLQAALEAYVRGKPASARTEQFARAAAQVGDWSAVLDGLRMIRQFAGEPIPGSITEIRRRLLAVEAYRQQYPQSPLARHFDEYLSVLKSAGTSASGPAATRNATPAVADHSFAQQLLSAASAFSGCGVALFDATQWRVLTDPQTLRSGDSVWAVTPQGDGRRLSVVGRVVGRSVQLDTGRMREVPQGAMVFLWKGTS